jgi:hypothetical protein
MNSTIRLAGFGKRFGPKVEQIFQLRLTANVVSRFFRREPSTIHVMTCFEFHPELTRP